MIKLCIFTYAQWSDIEEKEGARDRQRGCVWGVCVGCVCGVGWVGVGVCVCVCGGGGGGGGSVGTARFRANWNNNFVKGVSLPLALGKSELSIVELKNCHLDNFLNDWFVPLGNKPLFGWINIDHISRICCSKNFSEIFLSIWERYMLIKALEFITKSQETIALFLPEEAKCSFPLNSKWIYWYSRSNY